MVDLDAGQVFALALAGLLVLAFLAAIAALLTSAQVAIFREILGRMASTIETLTGHITTQEKGREQWTSQNEKPPPQETSGPS